MLKDYQGTISLKELSEMTAIKVEDVVSTLQHLNLIQYQKGQHVICAAPKLIERSANTHYMFAWMHVKPPAPASQNCLRLVPLLEWCLHVKQRADAAQDVVHLHAM